ncbi:MAG: phage portal protein, partial [Pseudorhodobacter sp.]|nr:phage portal protein [Pseudorhodobacter sp.]
DANAEIAQIEAGLKSRTQAIAERGYGAEQVDREIAADRKREVALSLDFRRPGSPAQAPGAADPNAPDPNDPGSDPQDPNQDPTQDTAPQEGP